ncbi:unnamed protein product [Ambrosiozyma monospora]|uniref:Unnamed protein product n=1 Tax=Ambrosiozyma monospora TaxID=43982 RepID=A0ACB5TCD2_AMBMO|nr:unnamed protein product [Ambrosiozyma monospora]
MSTTIQMSNPVPPSSSSTTTSQSRTSSTNDHTPTHSQTTTIKRTIPAITGDIVYTNPLFTLPPELTAYKSGILSYSASLVSTTIGFPLDSMKTRMQTHHFDNAFQCLRLTVHSEGVLGLFRGIAAPLISTSFARSFGVSVYTMSKPIVADLTRPIWGDEVLCKHQKGESKEQEQWCDVVNNVPVAWISGCIAGFTVSLFACPFEMTKIFQQLLVLVNNEHVNVGSTPPSAAAAIPSASASSTIASSSMPATSAASTLASANPAALASTSTLGLKLTQLPTTLPQVARSILHHLGPLGFYSGFKYHFLRDGLSSGLFYGIYETTKLMIQNINSAHADTSFHDSINLLSVPLAGAMAGCLSWVAVFPVDTVKSQVQRDSVFRILFLMKNGGNGDGNVGLGLVLQKKRKLRWPTREMYKGLGPSITRSITTTMIFFSLFEYLMQNIA